MLFNLCSTWPPWLPFITTGDISIGFNGDLAGDGFGETVKMAFWQNLIFFWQFPPNDCDFNCPLLLPIAELQLCSCALFADLIRKSVVALSRHLNVNDIWIEFYLLLIGCDWIGNGRLWLWLPANCRLPICYSGLVAFSQPWLVLIWPQAMLLHWKIICSLKREA